MGFRVVGVGRALSRATTHFDASINCQLVAMRGVLHIFDELCEWEVR